MRDAVLCGQHSCSHAVASQHACPGGLAGGQLGRSGKVGHKLAAAERSWSSALSKSVGMSDLAATDARLSKATTSFAAAEPELTGRRSSHMRSA